MGGPVEAKWNDELAQWRSRPLGKWDVGGWVSSRPKAAVLVVMAARADGSKVVVSSPQGVPES